MAALTGSRRWLAGLMLLAALPVPWVASAQDWRTLEQDAAWVGVFADHAISDRVALWFDGQWRRDGLLERPQQLLLRPGIQVTLAPGVRVGGGYAYIGTAQYGRAPLPAPLREHRGWQQLTFAHRAGPLSVSHRYRFEQRWLATDTAGAPAGSAYQQRARYMVRAQGELPGLRVAGRPVLGFVWDELLLPVGHGEPAGRWTQNRAGLGVGLTLSPQQRLELGYMHLWNALSAARVNEVNHTLTVSWVWTHAR
jgi:hypothetical protein